MIRRDVGSFLLKLFGMGATPTSGLVSVVRDVPVFPSSLVCPRPFVCFGCFVSLLSNDASFTRKTFVDRHRSCVRLTTGKHGQPV
jgi:hypothetical protein